MDRKTALVVIIVAVITAIIVMVYLLIKFGIIHGKITTTTTSTTTTTTSTLPTTTPTTTPSSSPIVTVNYCYNDCDKGQPDSITLPSQAGTTIQFTQYAVLLVNGSGLQRGQLVTVTIYNPSGTVVYTASVNVGLYGGFTMPVVTSSLTPNVKYKIVFSLGPDYYFYAVPVSQ